jgi:uncharacterized protein
MDSEWDEAKREANIAKHGIDFVAAVKVFDGPFIETEDRRRDYGDRRCQALGGIDTGVMQVVYTWRDDRRRIISARRARRNERRAYYAGIVEAGQEDEE